MGSAWCRFHQGVVVFQDEKNNAQIQIKLPYLLLIQNNYLKLKSPREFFFVTSYHWPNLEDICDIR